MTEYSSHDQEVKELFEQVSVEIPGGKGLRAINLESFKVAIDKMMNKAFYYGQQQAATSVEFVMDSVFNHGR